MRNINWTAIKAKLREAVLTLPHFFKNPVEGMRTLPDWEWPETLILQAIFASCVAFVSNLLDRDFLGAMTGLFIAPVSFILLTGIGSGFFYYLFKFYFHRDIEYRRIYINLLFAAIPALIVSIVAFMLPPIMLVGAVACALLLYVGFVSNFQLPQRKLRDLLIGMLIVYALFWVVMLIGNTSKHKTMRMKATPESLDILEKELNND